MAHSRLFPLSRRTSVAAGAFIVAALVGAAVVLTIPAATPGPAASTGAGSTATIEVNTLTGTDATGVGTPATATSPDGLVGFRVSSTGLAFGELEPGQASVPVRLEITNTGQVAMKLNLAASALLGPDGATIPASRLFVSTSTDSRGASLGGSAPLALDNLPVAAGATMVLYVTLAVPSGDEAYVPQGAYAGALTINASGVTA